MKKQKLSVSFGLVLILLTCLVSAPLKVYAGSANVVGASDDSSSSAGDNVSPITSEPVVEPAPGANVEINNNSATGDSDINISASPEVQNNVNEAAEDILQEAGNDNSSTVSSVGDAGNSNPVFNIVIIILLGGANAEGAISQVQTSLSSLGVSPSAMQPLLNALQGMISRSSASTSGVDMGSLKPVELVAGVKDLKTEITQNAAKPSVDLNKLNAAITAYNNIVMESSPEVLQKLAKDPQFLEISKVLKQLRSALNKR
jgi:hypothetical protein